MIWERFILWGLASLLVFATGVLSGIEPLFAIPAAAVVAACIATIKAENAAKLGALVILGFVPLARLNELAGPVSFTKILYIPTCAYLVWQRVLQRRGFVSSSQTRFVLLFGISLFLTLLLTGFPLYSMGKLRRYLTAIALYYLLLNVIENERDIKTVFVIMIGACLFSSVIGLFETATGTVQSHEVTAAEIDPERMTGATIVDANTFAAYVFVAMSPTAYFMFAGKRFWIRALSFMVTATLAATMAMTSSRSSVVVLGIWFCCLLYKFRRRLPLWKVALPLLCLGLCLLPLVPDTYYERMHRLIASAETDTSIQRRVGYQIIGLSLVAKSPLWGVGINAFPKYYATADFRALGSGLTYARTCHNLYLAVGAENGLLGLAFFLAVIFLSFRSLHYVKQSYPGESNDVFLYHSAHALELAMIAFFICGLFLPLLERDRCLWSLLAVTTSLELVRRRQLSLLK